MPRSLARKACLDDSGWKAAVPSPLIKTPSKIMAKLPAQPTMARPSADRKQLVESSQRLEIRSLQMPNRGWVRVALRLATWTIRVISGIREMEIGFQYRKQHRQGAAAELGHQVAQPHQKDQK